MKKKILVVDDESSIVSLLTELLEWKGYDVDGARDGLECLSKVKRNTYHTIILNVKMPKLCGWDTLERLNIIAPWIPVIMTSGHLSQEEGKKLVDMGAICFVEKPLDINIIWDEVEKAIIENERRFEPFNFEMKKKILVVDDDSRIVTELLEWKGYDVDGAGNGLECTSKVKRNTYHTIILNVKMPKLCGWDTLERLNIIAPWIPVIMTSGHLSQEKGKKLVDMGAICFLEKPFDMIILLDEIEKAIIENERRFGLL